MFYNNSDSTFSKVIQQLVFWLSLGAMFGLFIFLFSTEIKLPQHQISIEIDIKNKINICAPKNKAELQRSKTYEF